MNTTQLKEFTELAQASYAKFSPSNYKNDSATRARLSNEDFTPNGTFSEEQARLFTSQYTLLHQSTENTLDGFSATVFQDKSNPNRLVLSFRGTEFVGDKFSDLLLTDSQIGLSGYAVPQAAPLYRYVRQLQTVAGQPVNYTETEMQSIFALSIGGIVSSSVLLNTPAYTLFKNSLLNDVGINAGQAAGTALFRPGMEVDVAGHSLGGHLAMLAQRLFPGFFDDVVTVNAAGFYAGPGALPYSPQYYSTEAVLSLFGDCVKLHLNLTHQMHRILTHP